MSLRAFHLDDDLPRGRLAVEASAGTGKTFTLATLAARYVAEADVAIGDLLIVTFTRAAAAELKDRVRTRLLELGAALAADEPPADAGLAPAWHGDRAAGAERVARAVADFDAATITTIHGFAQQVLGTLGSGVPTDPDAVLLDDTIDQARRVTVDLLVAEALHGRHPADELPDAKALGDAVLLALGNPDAKLVPDPDADVDPAAAHLRRLVDRATAEVAARRLASGSLSFDDLLVRLRDALASPEVGPAARRALRDRYRVALIDEFQDTDPVQWSIFDTAFGPADGAGGDGAGGGPDGGLVLVGDPKQAIYAFRGANVHTYLQATTAPGVERTGLGTNWRSDGAALRATHALLDGVTFGDPRIAFQPVAPAEAHAEQRIASDDGPLPALSIRLVDGPGVPRGKTKATARFVHVERGTPVVYADLARHVHHLLGHARIPDGAGGTRPLRPDDVAVLIAANREGPVVRDALRRLGIPAVISRGDDVLGTPAADHWHRLLAAVARPTDVRRARGAALSWFVGWDAAQLAAADDQELSELQERFHDWGRHLAERGAAALVGRVWAETGVTERVLGLPDGDRAMTDLEHVGELVALAGGRSTSPTTLLTTFEHLRGGDDQGDPDADLAARRIESESRAVQIMTTYVAKGLEFPVVCCPSAWTSAGVSTRANIFWDEAAGVRTVDVASAIPWGDPDEAAERADRTAWEAVGSNLRVLYVALTRARHHTAVWFAPSQGAWRTGLARVLFARDDEGRIDPDAFEAEVVADLDADGCDAALAPVLATGGGTLEVVHVDADDDDVEPWQDGEPRSPAALAVATLDRPLDRARRVWSFTAVTASAHDGPAPRFDPFADALGDAGDADEGPEGLPGTPGAGRDADGEVASDLDGTPVPLGDIAGGAGFGTLVHEVLERVDFAAPDLEAELAVQVAERLAWSPWPVDVDALVDGLAAVVRSPLGPRFAGRALVDLPRTDRLDELDFDLTLGEGGHRATDAEVGRLVRDHLADDDPLRAWAEGLAAGPFATTLAGSLTGSIDLVARVRHEDGVERFVVCDYKTNRLAPAGTPATAGWYRPDRLPAAMAEHHYPLQALLYAVAVHRYLRWRLPGYDPAVHLGGVGYLFVRGLTGPAVPTVADVPYGLFDWDLPDGLVPALSDLLDGTGPTGRGR